MRLVRPVASVAFALSVCATACSLDFDEFEPSDASSTDGPGRTGSDGSADSPATETSAGDDAAMLRGAMALPGRMAPRRPTVRRPSTAGHAEPPRKCAAADRRL